VLPQHAPTLTQTAPAGQSRSPSHSSTVGQCAERKSTHFLSPPTVRAQVQKFLPRHLRKRGHTVLLMAGLSRQLLSVLLVSIAPTSSTPTPQPNSAARAPPAMSLSAWRREGPTVRALVISSKRYPSDASPRTASQRFLSFTSTQSSPFPGFPTVDHSVTRHSVAQAGSRRTTRNWQCLRTNLRPFNRPFLHGG
jgi:hypothetical protein